MSQACSLEQQNAHARLCHASSLYYAISIVHNKLDYCNSLYYKLSKSQLSRLQIQNSLARTVVKAPKFVSYHSHPTRSLHWLRITDSSSISDSLILSLVTFSSSDSPLCLFINPSVFYSRLKTYTCVTNPTPLFHFFPADCLHGLLSGPFLLSYSVFRSTVRQSRLNKAGIKRPSVITCVRIRQQKVSWISMKFGT